MNSIIDQIRLGELGEGAERAIVQGIMPLEPEVLICAIYFICSKSPEFLQDAIQTFHELPEGVKYSFCVDRRADGEIVGFLLRNLPLAIESQTVAILNPNTPGSALRMAAPYLETELLDLVVNNQMKILEEPGIIDALRENSGLSITQEQKLAEYERLLLKDLVSPEEELEDLSVQEVEEAAIHDAREFVSVFGKEKEGYLISNRQDRDGGQSLLVKISQMTIPQKIQAAIKGDREIRHILIKEPNKAVCTAVVKSPRITDGEVEFYSNLRNVRAEVLRLIAMNREWTRNYKIVCNLVKNPRTPLAFSIRLLNRVHKSDLKNLERDRGIPEALRASARRLVQSKG